MSEQLDSPLEVQWRYFSLDQVNSKRGDEWKVWEQSEEGAPALVAFKAAEAARRQGRAGFNRIHHALLEVRHARRQTLDRRTVTQAAAEAELDLDRFVHDLVAPDILASLAADHDAALELGVFGTPTLFFESGEGAYLKMRPAPEGAEALRVYNWLSHIVAKDTYVIEVKRPGK